MLTYLFLAGLIPTMMAKPVQPRGEHRLAMLRKNFMNATAGNSMMQRNLAHHHHHNLFNASSSMSVAPSQPTPPIIINLPAEAGADGLDAAAGDGSAQANIDRRQLNGYYVANPVPISAAPSLSASVSAVPLPSSFPVAVPPVLSSSVSLPIETPSIVPSLELSGPSYASSQCAQQCMMKCQTADIGFVVSQCKSDCASACASSSASGGSISGGDDGGDGSVVPLIGEDAKIPNLPTSTGKMANNADADVPSIPSTSYSTSDPSDCTCGGQGAGGGLLRREPQGTPLIPSSDDGVGAGTTMFMACMHGCTGSMQSADIGFDVSQGSGDCEDTCAYYMASGAGIADGKRSEA